MILLSLALAAGSRAEAASLNTLLTEKGTMIALKGEITREDANTLEILIRAANAHGGAVRGLQLDSTGGNLIGGIRLARLVRGHGDLSTAVVHGATCASACFLVFAAGREKFAGHTSFIGIHGAGDKLGRVTEESEEATRAMAHLCKQLGVPSPITEKLIATPPGEIVWLSSEELQSMGASLIRDPIDSAQGSRSLNMRSDLIAKP